MKVTASGIALVNLGYENSWREKPDIVKKCEELEHGRKGLMDNHSDYERCVSTYSCPVCGYTYKVDSSD